MYARRTFAFLIPAGISLSKLAIAGITAAVAGGAATAASKGVNDGIERAKGSNRHNRSYYSGKRQGRKYSQRRYY